MTSTGRSLAAALAASAVLAGCGLRSEPPSGGAPLLDAPVAAEAGSVVAPAPTPAAAVSSAGPAAAGPPAPAPVAAADAAPAGRRPPGGSTASGPPSSADAGSTVGVDASTKTLRVVLHGSAAGAAGARKYWDASGPGGGPRQVLGFRVAVQHLDEQQRDPARACEVAARSSFLLVSVAGAEQTRSCARSRLLQRDGVPYIGLGGADTGLGARHHFASSLTFRQQAPLVVRVARDNGFLDTRWAVVVVGSDASLADARDSIAEALERARVEGRAGPFDEARDVYVLERDASSCAVLGSRLRDGGYGSVHLLGATPLLFGQCVKEHPTAVYTGVGSTPEAAAVSVACQGSAGQFRGFHLSPTPDPDRARSLATSAPELADGEITGWAAMQMLEQALSLVKGPLGRASFTRALAGAGTAGGVLNPTAYRGQTRFGGTAAYANRSTCDGGKGVVTTVATYRRS